MVESQTSFQRSYRLTVGLHHHQCQDPGCRPKALQRHVDGGRGRGTVNETKEEDIVGRRRFACVNKRRLEQFLHNDATTRIYICILTFICSNSLDVSCKNAKEILGKLDLRYYRLTHASLTIRAPMTTVPADMQASSTTGYQM